VFLVEGEEEAGSGIHDRGFTGVVQDNLTWFEGTQAIIISNNYWIDDETPCLTYGMRGVIDFEVCVKGANKDLHAGVDGGPVFEPLVDLTYLLSLLWDSGATTSTTATSTAAAKDDADNDDDDDTTQGGESVVGGLLGPESGLAVPGLNDAVIGASEKEKEEWRKHVPQDYALALERMGVGRMKTADPVEILAWRWTRPSASVSSIATTNHAQAFRKIPHAVRARISLHFVPNQTSEHVLECVRSYLQQHFDKRNSGNELLLRTKQVSDWWLGDTENHMFRVAEEAVKEVWQKQPVLVREGGSFGGITAFLEGALKSPALHLPMGQSSDHAHLADERMRVHNLLQGKQVMKRFLALLAPRCHGATGSSSSPAKPK
jgi:acetylornithine deacetylase/succinyl-diaminopimelate desuccinylase-like protein